MSKDLTLDYYQTQLDDLEQDYKEVAAQLRVELDAPTRNRLERQIEQIGQRMTKWQQKIDQHQVEQQRQSVQVALNALIGILITYKSELELIIKAYRQTLRHWSVSVRAEASTVESIIGELGKIAQGSSSYTAREELIAHVVYQTSDPSLAAALNQWGAQHRGGIDWLQLYTQIQAAQDKRLEKAQPAILVTITRCDQASTQSQADESYYQLNAWLIEDIETYRSKKTGYCALVTSETPDAAPCLLENLLQKITDLLQHLLAEQRRVCEYCENYPQIHVFLPLELMHLGVDVWLLNTESRRPEYLGHDHVVVIRCANRYDRNYKKGPSWRKLWDRHQGLLNEPTKNVFVSGDDHDLDQLMDILDDAVQPASQVVGLQVSQPPLNTEELCYELLDSGLPLAIWSRRSLTNLLHESELSNLLAACCLAQLPHTVKNKRYETRRRQNTPECHIGHHLSLLWDDPYLVPPKSA